MRRGLRGPCGALKQVPAAEYNPMECIKTNVLGAWSRPPSTRGWRRWWPSPRTRPPSPSTSTGPRSSAPTRFGFRQQHRRFPEDPLRRGALRQRGGVSGLRGALLPGLLEKRGLLPAHHGSPDDPFLDHPGPGSGLRPPGLRRMQQGELFVPKSPPPGSWIWRRPWPRGSPSDRGDCPGGEAARDHVPDEPEHPGVSGPFRHPPRHLLSQLRLTTGRTPWGTGSPGGRHLRVQLRTNPGSSRWTRSGQLLGQLTMKRSVSFAPRLGLGTAQLGLDYGVANRTGNARKRRRPGPPCCLGERSVADRHGSAERSEPRIGRALRVHLKGLRRPGGHVNWAPPPACAVSDLPRLGKRSDRVPSAFGVPSVQCSAGAPSGGSAGAEPGSGPLGPPCLQERGCAAKIGFSCYEPEEALQILRFFTPQVVQLPLEPPGPTHEGPGDPGPASGVGCGDPRTILFLAGTPLGPETLLLGWHRPARCFGDCVSWRRTWARPWRNWP